MMTTSTSEPVTVHDEPKKGGALANSLALDRTYLAGERTLMGWIRTAISMISFGFTIGKLSQIVDDIHLKGLLRARTFSVEGVAESLVILGTGGLVMACFQHWDRIRVLCAMGFHRPISITLVIGVLLSALGGFAFMALVMAL